MLNQHLILFFSVLQCLANSSLFQSFCENDWPCFIFLPDLKEVASGVFLRFCEEGMGEECEVFMPMVLTQGLLISLLFIHVPISH